MQWGEYVNSWDTMSLGNFADIILAIRIHLRKILYDAQLIDCNQ